MLTTAWGTLTILSANHGLRAPAARYVNPTARERPIVEACVRFWPELEALGPRFWHLTFPPRRFADKVAPLAGLLIKLGIARERVIDRPLDDFLALAAEVGITPDKAAE